MHVVKNSTRVCENIPLVTKILASDSVDLRTSISKSIEQTK